MQVGMCITEIKRSNSFVYIALLSFFYQIIIFHAVFNDVYIVGTFIRFSLATQLDVLNSVYIKIVYIKWWLLKISLRGTWVVQFVKLLAVISA